MEHVHEHKLADGTVIVHAHVSGEAGHAHPHNHPHNHTHSHTQTKAVLNRMSRLIGHLQSIRRMVEDGRDCSEVLIQLSAVNAAIRSVSKVILKDHLEHCVVDAVHDNDHETIEQLTKAIDQFIR